MKLIKQNFEILEQKDFSLIGIKKFIERCGRVCYKSEDRITDDSYEKFVNMLESRGHDRPLEFGTVHLKMPWKTFSNFTGFCISKGFWDSCWIKYNIDRESEDKMVYITTNYRYYKKLGTLKPLYGYVSMERFFTEEDNKFYPKRYTVHFITSRGIMDEFRTHVGLSHLAESSRYCSYDKNRFGNELTFIIPNWFNKYINADYSNFNTSDWNIGLDIDDAETNWLYAMMYSEKAYISSINHGMKPQQARAVLPNSLKTELIMTGFDNDLKHFFELRSIGVTGAPHPQAKELADMVKDKFNK